MNRFKIEKLHKLILSLERIQTARAKRLFKIINENKSLAVEEIFVLMGDKDNTIISRELKYLMNYNMVKFERKGKYKHFDVNFEGVEKLQNTIAGI